MPARDCVGAARCPYGAECFAEASRVRAREADIVVTNHSLLAVDMLADRHIVPPHKLLIVDEAHELADRVSLGGPGRADPGGGRAGRQARPPADLPGRRRGAGRGGRLAAPSASATSRPVASPRGCRRCCTRRCCCWTTATRAALDGIGDIKNDDPDPVRKQQAKATLDDLSKTAQRLLEESDVRRRLGGEVRPRQRPPRAGGRAPLGRGHAGHQPVRRAHGGGDLGDPDPGRPLRHRRPLPRPARRRPRSRRRGPGPG